MFTACRTFNGRIFRLGDHLDRLYRCAESIFMQPPCDRDELRKLLDEVLDRNRQESGAQELRLEVIFSGGLLNDTMKQSGKGAHLYVAVEPLAAPPAGLYEKGVSLATFPHQRMMPDVKLLNYVGAVLAHQTVVPRHHAFDVLYVDPDDRRTVLEGSTFAVFFVDSEGDILTPPLDGKILDSVTRRVVFDILEPVEAPNIRESPIYLDELSRFKESFLASTTRNVLPVTRIDDLLIGDGKPGLVTASVTDLFMRYMKSF